MVFAGYPLCDMIPWQGWSRPVRAQARHIKKLAHRATTKQEEGKKGKKHWHKLELLLYCFCTDPWAFFCFFLYFVFLLHYSTRLCVGCEGSSPSHQKISSQSHNKAGRREKGQKTLAKARATVILLLHRSLGFFFFFVFCLLPTLLD